jgi:transposase-like protein
MKTKTETKTETKAEKTDQNPLKEGRYSRHTAQEKCRAVLALWTERSTGSELCKEMNTTWNVLNLWQEQAMEGMMQALEPRRKAERASSPLSPRLQGLLERKAAARSPSGQEIPWRRSPGPGRPPKQPREEATAPRPQP